MTTEALVNDYVDIFGEDIELIVRSKISEEIHDEIFNGGYYQYIENNNSNKYMIEQSLKKLLKKAERNYKKAKKLYFDGRLSSVELYEYRARIDEIQVEINNLNL